MKLCYLAFSDRGLALAQRLAGALGGQAVRCGGPVTLAGWTAEHFVTGAAWSMWGPAALQFGRWRPIWSAKPGPRRGRGG